MNQRVKSISLAEISRLTGVTRETIVKKLGDLKFTIGDSGAKMFNAKEALRCMYVSAEGGSGTPQDRLAEKRAEEISLNMEVTRKERIPVEDAEEANDQVLQNCAGIFKAHEGKVLTPELIQEIFTELRRIDETLSGYVRGAPKGEAPATEEPPQRDVLDDPMF